MDQPMHEAPTPPHSGQYALDEGCCCGCGAKGSDDDNAILLCDGCDRGYHQYCLTPALDAVPADDWFCPTCSSARQLGDVKPVVVDTTRGDTHAADENDSDASYDSDDLLSNVGMGKDNAKENSKRAFPTESRAKSVKRAKATAQSQQEARQGDGAVKVKVKRAAGASGGQKKKIGAGAALAAVRALLGGAVDEPMEQEQQQEEEEEEEEDLEQKPALDEHVMLVPDARLKEIKKSLLATIDTLELPPNPLDYLIDLCGGTEMVAEMTGRNEQMVREEDGNIVRRARAETVGMGRALINNFERDNFQNGQKLVAIISEAASSGVSLQADRRQPTNQRRRLHITLELPWSADRAIQQFGRSHRSNQVSCPVYKIMVTDVGGEARFAASAAKRLQALGALLKADRRAMGAGSELKVFDIDNKYGAEALKQLYHELVRGAHALPGLTLPTVTSGECFRTHMTERLRSVGLNIAHKLGQMGRTARWNKKNVPTFLNKMLGLGLDDQKLLFDYFFEIFAATVRLHKSKGDYSEGLVEMKADGGIHMIYSKVVHTCPISGAPTSVVSLKMDRGVSVKAALEKSEECVREREVERTAAEALVAAAPRRGGLRPVVRQEYTGFWVSKGTTTVDMMSKSTVLVALEVRSRWRHVSNRNRSFRVMRPNNGAARPMDLEDLQRTYNFVEHGNEHAFERAKRLWAFWYDRLNLPMDETFGIHPGRNKSLYLLSGAVLPMWKMVLETYTSLTSRISKDSVTVVRVELANGERIVGLHPAAMDEQMVERLAECCGARFDMNTWEREFGPDNWEHENDNDNAPEVEP